MTRTEALRKLYKKITNEEAPVTANTITEVLVALADKYSGDEPVAANTITDALVALADNYSGGGGGGQPLEPIGIEFVEIEIISNTPPQGESAVTDILSFSSIVMGGYNAEISTPQLPTKMVIPVKSGETTQVSLNANSYSYILDSANSTFTGGITADESGIYVTGTGTATLVWKLSY